MFRECAGMNRILTLLASVSACHAPGPGFRDVPMQVVTVQGSTFHVRIKDNQGEAIRVTPEYAPRLGPVGARAAMAMQVASGCKIHKITGDAAVVLGVLSCGDVVPSPSKRFPRHLELDCYEIDSYLSAATHQIFMDYDCDLIATGEN